MLTLELAENMRRLNVASPMVDLLLRKQLLQNHSKFSIDEKQKILTQINTLLRQFKGYIYDNLNPAKVNVIYPTKYNFTQPLSVKEVLEKLKFSKND